MFIRLLIIISIFSGGNIHGQLFNNKIEQQDKEILSLKNEIEKTRQSIKKESSKERTTAKKISAVEKEISLTDQLINKLSRVERRTRSDINKLSEYIPENEQKLAEYLIRYERRAVQLYKKSTMTPLMMIVSATSWRQAVYRTRYMQIVSEIETAIQDSIQLLLVDITNQKDDLNRVLRKNIDTKNEKARRKNSLDKSKREKQKDLRKIQQNKKELEKYLAEKQAGLKQLEAVRKKLFASKGTKDREERIREQREYLNTKSFVELKGKLPWPVNGNIVTKFGNYINPELKTTTENPGIDIAGKSGAPVRSVLNGIVTTITFIRGYGTTVIVDHGHGYFTVYTHLTDLQIHEDSEVRGGDVIASIGDANAVSGAKLHFEIWGNQQKLDPEKWLMR